MYGWVLTVMYHCEPSSVSLLLWYKCYIAGVMYKLQHQHSWFQDVMHTICSPYGQVLRIVIFKKNGVQAMVEYPLSYLSWWWDLVLKINSWENAHCKSHSHLFEFLAIVFLTFVLYPGTYLNLHRGPYLVPSLQQMLILIPKYDFKTSNSCY